jgi:hypothetical protein
MAFITLSVFGSMLGKKSVLGGLFEGTRLFNLTKIPGANRRISQIHEEKMQSYTDSTFVARLSFENSLPYPWITWLTIAKRTIRPRENHFWITSLSPDIFVFLSMILMRIFLSHLIYLVCYSRYFLVTVQTCSFKL